MDLLRRGRARAEFEAFAANHVDGLLRSAYLMAGDRGEAEDLVQECMLRIARKWPRVRSMQHPGAYARRVLFSLILDGGRTRRRRRTELREALACSDGVAGEDLLAVRAEQRLDLVQALSGLPARQRAVLVLRYFADLPESEVAEIIGCAPGTVKSSAARGLTRLREVLDSTPPPLVDDSPRR
jgi:RNA polymerase sigma-70 factor (sigma-E family)